MAQTTFASRLRYLDAGDVDDSVVNFDGLDVRGRDNEKLGDIDGFIVDVTTGRVVYAVIDSSGWFTTRRFLLPIGHAGIVDRAHGALRVDLPRAALEKYPRFEEDRFQELSDEDLWTFEKATAAACCVDERVERGAWPYDRLRHYAQPAWWNARTYESDRLRAVSAGVFTPPSAYAEGFGETSTKLKAEAEATSSRDRHDGERAVAQARSESDRDDVSPHFDGRAQPGDVLGIETGGERTYVGDTSEDENARRRHAERERARDEDEPRRSER